MQCKMKSFFFLNVLELLQVHCNKYIKLKRRICWVIKCFELPYFVCFYCEQIILPYILVCSSHGESNYTIRYNTLMWINSENQFLSSHKTYNPTKKFISINRNGTQIFRFWYTTCADVSIFRLKCNIGFNFSLWIMELKTIF